jgi:ABC-type uncharacterized transport system involved in gliding motility auxiliary subunit
MQINIKNRKVLTGLTLVLIFFSLIVVNFMSNKLFSFARLDLTQNRIFSLSEGSKKILASIDEPITLKLFFSRHLAKENPYFLSFAVRVEEFLKQYQRYSNKKITLQVIDPEPFTEYEDQAVHYGLQGVPVNNEGTELYFGLVASNSVTGKEIIPFFQPNREGYLEYDITRLIAKLSNTTTNKIAVITSLPISGEPGFQFMPDKARPWVIWRQIAQQFDAKILETTEKEQISVIPQDIKVLLLINTGEQLPLVTAKAVDQFVLRGGRVLLLLDPVSEIKNNANSEEQTANEMVPINKLLQAWGVNYDANKIVASREFAKQVRYNYQGKETVGLYPLWIDVDASSLAKNDVLTANLAKLTFASAGAISANDQGSSKFVPLVVIKKDAMLVNKNDLTKYKANPVSLLREYQPENNPITIAARVTGKIKSAFSEEFSTEQANIVIIANADFLHDHFWATAQNFLGNQIIVPTSGNGNLILNALDNLSGSDALISVRNKDSYTKGFDKIHEIELKSQSRFQQAEEALLKRMEETKQKLSAMAQQKLSVEHRQEEEAFRKDLISTRKQLREVRRSLREDIQVLENRIKFFSIIFMPLVIALLCTGYWLFGNKWFSLFRHKKI